MDSKWADLLCRIRILQLVRNSSADGVPKICHILGDGIGKVCRIAQTITGNVLQGAFTVTTSMWYRIKICYPAYRDVEHAWCFGLQ